MIQNLNQSIYVEGELFNDKELLDEFKNISYPLGQLVFEENKLQRYSPMFDQNYSMFVNTFQQINYQQLAKLFKVHSFDDRSFRFYS
jgi:hypothetical protein